MFAAAALLAGVVPQAAQAAQKRVLLVTEARGFVHESIGPTATLIRRLGVRSPDYHVVKLNGAARELAEQEQGELVIHAEDGSIREKDSHGNDPRNIPG